MAFPHDGKKFDKGKTGNAKGRPRKIPAIDVLLADVLGDKKQGKTYAETILIALRKKAAKGDTRAAELLLDRAYGKARQTMDVNIEGVKSFLIEPASGGTKEDQGK